MARLGENWVENPNVPQPESVLCKECGEMYGHVWSISIAKWILIGCDNCAEKEIEEMRKADRKKEIEKFERTIPPAYREAHFKNLKGFDDMVEAFKEKKQDLILITGPAGVGKTYALYAIYRHAYHTNRRVEYIDLREFLFNLKLQSGNNYFDNASNVQNISEFQGILLLDDLGSESGSKVTQEAVDIILSRREKWREGLTVVTTNLSMGEIGQVFDDRLASRLSGGTVIRISGKDRRME